MAESSARREEDEPIRTPPVRFCLKIGFFAGLIWGSVRWLAVAMNLTKVPAAFLADPWVKRSALASAYWQITGLALFILMSMAAALVYYVVLKPYRGPYPGLLFGAAWWAGFYLWAGPSIGAVPPLNKIGWNSMITDGCLFLIWGLFIGYSIAFEFHDEARREPEPAAG
ncbi:YqhR family membrane protein [Cohnella caldifontis]|uniref:YqhR family membrane protein n=1 Tax=Cohnella caldifontis TaxID=3027471 RepID=UPI0023EB9443|nr:YqhR family membrane protein [Cohnella sp. YIM B05605]